MRRQQRTGWRRFLGAGVAVVSIAPLLVSVSGTAGAASSKGCEGGGFRLVNLATGATVAMGGARSRWIAPSQCAILGLVTASGSVESSSAST